LCAPSCFRKGLRAALGEASFIDMVTWAAAPPAASRAHACGSS